MFVITQMQFYVQYYVMTYGLYSKSLILLYLFYLIAVFRFFEKHAYNSYDSKYYKI